MGRKKKLTADRLKQILDEEIWITLQMNIDKQIVRMASINKVVDRVGREFGLWTTDQ